MQYKAYKQKNITKEVEKEIYLLLDEYLSIGGNHRSEKSKAMNTKVHNFIMKHEVSHVILDDILLLTKIDSLSKNIFYYEKSEELIEPILERLNESQTWEPIIVRLAIKAIAHGGNLEREMSLAKRVIDVLESNPPSEYYFRATIAIHNNRSTVLFKHHYLKREDVPNIDVKEEFLSSIETVLSLSENHDYPISHSTASIKKGLFLDDKELIKKGYDKLRSLREKEVISLMKSEENRYNFFIKDQIGELVFREFVGRALKKERTSRNYRTEDLAHNTGIAKTTIAQAENGNRGISLYNFFKLSRAFNLSMDKFLQIDNFFEYFEPEIPPSENLDELIDLLKNLSTEDLSILDATARAMIKGNLHK